MEENSSYPKSQSVLLMNSPSKDHGALVERLEKFGYEFAITKEAESLAETFARVHPAIVVFELQIETPNEDLEKQVLEIRSLDPEIRILGVFSGHLKYNMGQVKTLGFNSIFQLSFEDNLYINEIFEFAPIELPWKGLSLEALTRVNIIELEDQPLPFDVLVYLPSNKKTILYRQKGHKLEDNTVAKFKKHSHFNLYIKKSDLKVYKKHSASVLTKLKNDDSLSAEVKKRKIAGEVKKLMGGFFDGEDFSGEDCQQIVDNVGRVVEEFVEETCEDKGMLKAVEALAGEHMTSYTHARNVATYSVLFGLSKGVGTADELHMGGLLHDIGMSDFPSELLWKPEEDMTDKELAQFKLHPGNARLEINSRGLKVTENIMKMIAQHHERPDGSGFPYGLIADEIHPLAKICAFADEFDRLTSVRQGEKMHKPAEAIDHISGEGGSPPLSVYEKEFHASICEDFKNDNPLPSIESLKNNDSTGDVIQLTEVNIVDVEGKAPSEEAEETISVDGKILPVEEEAISVDGKALPVEDKEIRVEGKALPVEEESISVNGKVQSADTDNVKVDGKNISAESLDIEKIKGSSLHEDSEIIEISGDVSGDELNSQLIQSATNGDLKEVTHLVDQGADINTQDAEGNTPLMLAAQNGHTEVAEELLNYGADINITNDDDETVVDIVENSQHEMLLKSIQDFKNKSRKPTKTPGMVRAGISAKGFSRTKSPQVDVNKRNKKGQTLLIQFAAKGDLEMVQQFLDLKADVNAKDFNGFTPLIFASHSGHDEIVKVLLKKGAKTTPKDGKGRTALNHAVEHRHYESAKALLEAGARADLRVKGLSLLMIAAFTGQQEMCELLVKHGARIDDRDYKGKKATDYAFAQGYTELAEFLSGNSLKSTG